MTIGQFEVIVIGAGPSGATAAALLAAAGWSVALVEKKVFPRRKVCGEVISATNFPILTELGVWPALHAHAGPALREVGFFSGAERIIAPLPALQSSADNYARTCAREHLDDNLLAAARQRGVVVWSPYRATALTRSSGGKFLCQLQRRDSGGQQEIVQLQAPLVIAAHGSWETSGLPTQAYLHQHRADDLIACKAHFTGCRLSPGLLPVLAFPGGYGGIVNIGGGRTTFAYCIRRDVLKRVRLQAPALSAAEASFQYVLEHVDALREILQDAQIEGDWLVVGPLRPGQRRVLNNGVLVIGNALCETHPLIGEGISMAMQSAWLLCQHLQAHRNDIDNADQVAALATRFLADWRAKYAWRARAASLFAHAAMRPPLVRTALPLLRRYPALLTFAARLAGKVQMLSPPATS